MSHGTSMLMILRGAGMGGLGLTIEGASEAKMFCKDNKDGSCSVEYMPFTAGDYDINITYGGHPIPGKILTTKILINIVTTYTILLYYLYIIFFIYT